VPFEFTGNQERAGDLLLKNDAQIVQFLSGDRRVVVVLKEDTFQKFHDLTGALPLHLVGKSGVWQLYANH
jgi:hypothetical protein